MSMRIWFFCILYGHTGGSQTTKSTLYVCREPSNKNYLHLNKIKIIIIVDEDIKLHHHHHHHQRSSNGC